MLKSSKRLILSILALIASVALCLGVCLAWFATNKKVDGNGLQTQLRDRDIIDFTVTVYYLNAPKTGSGDNTNNLFTTDNGNNDKDGNLITVGINNASLGVDNVTQNGQILGTSTNKENMRPFSLGGAYTTTVLIKLDYTLSKDAESTKTFRIFAECDDSPIAKVESDGSDNYKSNLSNAVKFNDVADNQSVTPYTAIGKDVAFSPLAGANGVDYFTFPKAEGDERLIKHTFFDGIQATGDSKNADGNYVGTRLLMMDYDSEEFAYLSSLMLEKGGSLTSKLNLIGDITFGMEVYSSTSTHTHTASGDWISDDTYHWHVCKDGDAIVDIAAHVDANTDKTCDDCGHDVSEIHVHTKGNTWHYDANKHWKTCTSGDGYRFDEADHTYVNDECSDCHYVRVTRVTVSGTNGAETSEVEAGNTITLSANVEPANATYKNNVTWSSSDSTVATVSNGVVRGVKAGTVTITATVGNVTSQTYTVTVNAASEPMRVTSVTITGANKVTAGQTITLSATVEPDNATNRTVTWAITSGADYATINASTGVLKGESAGTVTVVATADGVSSQAYTVEVEAATVTTHTVTFNMNGHGNNVTQTVNDGAKVTAPDNPTATGYRFDGWYTTAEYTTTFDFNSTISSDTTIYAKWTEVHTVTFNMNGHGTKVTRTVDHGEKVERPGNPSISGFTFGGWYNEAGCTTEFNFNSTITSDVTVYAKWTAVEGGYTANGTYTLDIAGGVDKGLFTSTYDTTTDSGYQGTHFKVSGSDKLHITMKLPANKVIKITGKAVVSNATKGDSSLMLVSGTGTTGAVDSYGDQLTVSKENGGDINYTLKVTTEGVIVIDIIRGNIKNTGSNITQLSVTISDPESTPDTKPVERVSLNKTTLSLAENATETLTATITPSDATNQEITWSSNKTSVATVDSTGKVTAVGEGTATITATAGGKTANCTVTVTHTHTYETGWSSDDTNHWHAANCGHTDQISGNAAHSWDEGVVTTAATATTKGVKTYTCTVCERQKTEEIPATGSGETTKSTATITADFSSKKPVEVDSDGILDFDFVGNYTEKTSTIDNNTYNYGFKIEGGTKITITTTVDATVVLYFGGNNSLNVKVGESTELQPTDKAATITLKCKANTIYEITKKDGTNPLYLVKVTED